MKLKLQYNSIWMAGAIASGLALFGGFFLFYSASRLKHTLVRASYDWSFDLRSEQPADLDESNVMIIYLDMSSHRQLDQPFNQAWDRGLHAKLIDRLTDDGAKAVIFDVLFTDAGRDAESDRALEKAIRRNGRVVLASDFARSEPVVRRSFIFVAEDTISRPHAPFADGAAATGLARLRPDSDFTIRQHFHGIPEVEEPSLAWAAAEFLDMPATRDPSKRFLERWVNYYGPPFTVPSISYSRALDTSLARPGYFRDKIVFIGAGQPLAGYFNERRDEFRSPFSRLHPQLPFMPAVEVQATTLLNLVRQDWLVRLAPVYEWIILIVVAALAGFGLSRLHPVPATLFAIGATGGTMLLAAYLFKQHQFWFPWFSVVAGQIPLAWLVSIVVKSVEWLFQRRRFEQQSLRAELQITEQAAFLDKAHDAIIVQDLTGNVTFWNQGAERLYGWRRAEVIGRDLTSLLFKDGHRPADAWSRVMHHAEWNGELQHCTKSGATVTVESRWTLVENKGARKSVLMINTDVTEQKKIEGQLLRAQRMESIGTLAGGIAHDLNNVLTPILMSVDLLRRYHDDPETSAEILKTVETSARRGAGLVKQVLTFARGHEGERTILSLVPLVKEMDKVIRETFPKSIHVRTNVQPGLRPISADATQLHQVLLNLCVNARDAMPNGGCITIDARNVALSRDSRLLPANGQPGDFVLLAVSDTGTGIPPEILDRIFEPFFTTKEVGKGTGLGLSTVVSIVKSHGGFVEVQSHLAKGTHFEIYLPAVTAETAVQDASGSPDMLMGTGEMILLVDDEQAVRTTVSAALTQAGYRVIAAAGGTEAVPLCLAHFDDVRLVLVDLMMPGMDGFATVEALREVKPDLRFITMSGALQGEKLKQQLQAARTTFLPKPFTSEKLFSTIQAELKAIETSSTEVSQPSQPQKPFELSV